MLISSFVSKVKKRNDTAQLIQSRRMWRRQRCLFFFLLLSILITISLYSELPIDRQSALLGKWWRPWLDLLCRATDVNHTARDHAATVVFLRHYGFELCREQVRYKTAALYWAGAWGHARRVNLQYDSPEWYWQFAAGPSTTVEQGPKVSWGTVQMWCWLLAIRPIIVPRSTFAGSNATVATSG